ncbi:hypothetical protein [Algoriphagus sp. AK58]|uniref:hypothetical protein n=1 Tax=Algoriphagus sp. AK58 TaxID=1406877 RepID=UPI0016502BE6|nr:hypothetical protein [Algoriphagus sp. AK58]
MLVPLVFFCFLVSVCQDLGLAIWDNVYEMSQCKLEILTFLSEKQDWMQPSHTWKHLGNNETIFKNRESGKAQMGSGNYPWSFVALDRFNRTGVLQGVDLDVLISIFNT